LRVPDWFRKKPRLKAQRPSGLNMKCIRARGNEAQSACEKRVANGSLSKLSAFLFGSGLSQLQSSKLLSGGRLASTSRESQNLCRISRATLAKVIKAGASATDHLLTLFLSVFSLRLLTEEKVLPGQIGRQRGPAGD